MVLRDLGRGRGGHMTTTKLTSKTAAGRIGLHPPPAEKPASPQNDRPPKPVRRVAPKRFRPVIVGKLPSASAPTVILWDDPVDLPVGAKPKS